MNLQVTLVTKLSYTVFFIKDMVIFITHKYYYVAIAKDRGR